VGADDKSPSREIICSAKVLLLDSFGARGMIRAARIARAAGVPVVGDFESSDVPRFNQLLALVEHLILSEDFACECAKTKSPGLAAKRLWNKRRNVVIVTCGAKGSVYFDSGSDRPRRVPAFKVKARDTTGCGDVFHGAYAASLVRGMELQARIRFAAAAAALHATRRPGQTTLPTRREVEKFLTLHPE
jgi:sulfofructose kinase